MAKHFFPWDTDWTFSVELVETAIEFLALSIGQRHCFGIRRKTLPEDLQ
jgi:hypothetical protein